MFVSRHPCLLIELWGQAKGGRHLPASLPREEAGHPGARSRCGPGPDWKVAHGEGRKCLIKRVGENPFVRKTSLEVCIHKAGSMTENGWEMKGNRNIYGVSSPQPVEFSGWNKALCQFWDRIPWNRGSLNNIRTWPLLASPASSSGFLKMEAMRRDAVRRHQFPPAKEELIGKVEVMRLFRERDPISAFLNPVRSLGKERCLP